MYKNNFDCSSSGLNIEVSAYYSSWGSQNIFEDTYKVVRNRYSRRDMCIRVIDFDTVPEKLSDVGVFKTGKRGPIPKQIVCDMLNEYSDYCYDCQSFTYKELYDELKNIDVRYLPRLTEDNEYQHYFNLNKDLSLYGSSGYSQGDFTYVLCKYDTCKNYHYLIDRELWDCPVWANVQIADCEYRYDELMSDQYYWDKPKYIEEIVKAHTNDVNLQNKLKEQLNRLLPEELDYV